MKQHIRYIILLAGISLLTSCQGFLGNIPKGYQIPSSVEEYDLLLNDEQLVFLGCKYLDIMTDEMHVPATLPDNYIQISLQNMIPAWRNMYLFGDQFFSETEIDIVYEDAYKRIFTYNAIIEGLKSADGSESEKDRVRAEAQVGRALEYLILVNVYSPGYDPAKAKTTPAIPLILSDDISIRRPPLATQEEIYGQIYADIESAIPHLTQTPKTNAYRVSKPAAHAILAKAAFQKKEYTTALKYARLALEGNDALLDMTPLTLDINEWATGARNNYPAALLNPESIFIRHMPLLTGLNEYILVGHHIPKLYDTEHDMRYTLFVTTAPSGDPEACPPGELVWNPAVEFNVGMSTPDMYLIVAECEARIGDKAKAVEILNKLRDNRIKENKPLSIADQKDLIGEVIAERQREFLFRGFFRYLDLKRLSTDPDFAVTITHYGADGSPIVSGPSSPKYLYHPLPEKVLTFRNN